MTIGEFIAVLELLPPHITIVDDHEHDLWFVVEVRPIFGTSAHYLKLVFIDGDGLT